MIGRRFRYPSDERVFTVCEVRTHSIRFDCGHWCTDNVFRDLIPVAEDGQMDLFGNNYLTKNKQGDKR
jgi:hypothetical protein